MPESQCSECNKRLIAGSHGELRRKELLHHVTSYGKDKEAPKEHKCSVFMVYNDQGILLGQIDYAHGEYKSDHELYPGAFTD